eukprot:Lankesteria_metandrocarpae@DN2347_c0_g1_i1.p1
MMTSITALPHCVDCTHAGVRCSGAVAECMATGTAAVAVSAHTATSKRTTAAISSLTTCEHHHPALKNNFNIFRNSTTKMVNILLLVCTFIWIPSIRLCSGEVVYGLADNGNVQLLTDFCFTIPHGQTGSVHSQTIVNIPDQRLLVVSDKTLLDELRSGRSMDCLALQDAARVVEGLETPPNSLAAYDLHLTVDPNVSHKDVAVVATNCHGGSLSLSYKLALTNPGSILSRHFSCENQGVLQLYLVLLPVSVVCLLCTYERWKAVKLLYPSTGTGSAVPPVVVGAFLAACFLWGAVLLNVSHVVLFAMGGSADSVLRLGALFANFLFFVSISSVLVTLSLGERLLRSRHPSTHTSAASTGLRLSPLITGYTSSPTNTSTGTGASTNISAAANLVSSTGTGGATRVGDIREGQTRFGALRAGVPGVPLQRGSVSNEVVKSRSDAQLLVKVAAVCAALLLCIGMRNARSQFLYDHYQQIWAVPYFLVRGLLGLFIFTTLRRAVFANGADSQESAQRVNRTAIFHAMWCFNIFIVFLLPKHAGIARDSIIFLIDGVGVMGLVIQVSTGERKSTAAVSCRSVLAVDSKAKPLTTFGTLGGDRQRHGVRQYIHDNNRRHSLRTAMLNMQHLESHLQLQRQQQSPRQKEQRDVLQGVIQQQNVVQQQVVQQQEVVQQQVVQQQEVVQGQKVVRHEVGTRWRDKNALADDESYDLVADQENLQKWNMSPYSGTVIQSQHMGGYNADATDHLRRCTDASVMGSALLSTPPKHNSMNNDELYDTPPELYSQGYGGAAGDTRCQQPHEDGEQQHHAQQHHAQQPYAQQHHASVSVGSGFGAALLSTPPKQRRTTANPFFDDDDEKYYFESNNNDMCGTGSIIDGSITGNAAVENAVFKPVTSSNHGGAQKVTDGVPAPVVQNDHTAGVRSWWLSGGTNP